MKKTFLPLIFICTALIWTSCTKPADTPTNTNTNPSPTDLKFSIVDNVGNAVPSATINLYKTQTDYANNTNLVGTQATGNDGTTTFNNLDAIVYYYDISRSSDCSTNKLTTNHTSNPISAATTNTISVVVNQVGQLNFVNSSTNPYYVYINGALWNTVNGGTTQSAIGKVGAYAIEVKQVSGYISFPTDEKSNQTITACSNININFP